VRLDREAKEEKGEREEEREKKKRRKKKREKTKGVFLPVRLLVYDRCGVFY